MRIKNVVKTGISLVMAGAVIWGGSLNVLAAGTNFTVKPLSADTASGYDNFTDLFSALGDFQAVTFQEVLTCTEVPDEPDDDDYVYVIFRFDSTYEYEACFLNGRPNCLNSDDSDDDDLVDDTDTPLGRGYDDQGDYSTFLGWINDDNTYYYVAVPASSAVSGGGTSSDTPSVVTDIADTPSVVTDSADAPSGDSPSASVPSGVADDSSALASSSAVDQARIETSVSHPTAVVWAGQLDTARQLAALAEGGAPQTMELSGMPAVPSYLADVFSDNPLVSANYLYTAPDGHIVEATINADTLRFARPNTKWYGYKAIEEMKAMAEYDALCRFYCPGEHGTYRISTGDTWETISAKLGISVSELKDKNFLLDIEGFEPGRTVVY